MDTRTVGDGAYTRGSQMMYDQGEADPTDPAKAPNGGVAIYRLLNFSDEWPTVYEVSAWVGHQGRMRRVTVGQIRVDVNGRRSWHASALVTL